MLTDKQIAEMNERQAREMAQREIDRVADLLLDYSRKVRDRAKGIRTYKGKDAASSVEYAVNDVENMLRNVNFAALARVTAELASAIELNK